MASKASTVLGKIVLINDHYEGYDTAVRRGANLQAAALGGRAVVHPARWGYRPTRWP